MVRIKVSDNGKGWPSKDRQKLLEPYVTTREKGTGLGLAIVTRIIEQHGGTVELMDSEADAQGRVGACFSFTLPLNPPHDAGSAPDDEDAQWPEGEPEPADVVDQEAMRNALAVKL